MAARLPTRRPKAASPNAALMRAVMAACNRHGLDDDARREIQQDVVGKVSMRDMTAPELVKLRDHLNRGWNGPRQQRPVIGKIRALWWSLYWIGAIDAPNDEALTAFVKRQTHVAHLNFLDHKMAPRVIEALKSWLEREGVMWWSADKIAEIAAVAGNTFAGTPFTQAEADRHAVLDQLAIRLDRAGLLARFALYDWIGAAVGRPACRTWSLSSSELDAGLRALGKKYRAHLAKEQRL